MLISPADIGNSNTQQIVTVWKQKFKTANFIQVAASPIVIGAICKTNICTIDLHQPADEEE